MIAAIIQARMGSTRLPGKVLKKVCGKTMLELLVERLRRAKSLDKIIIATTDKSADKKIISAARKIGVEVFRGSENDVLDRYYQTAKKYQVDDIVRITSDCPLMDPAIVDRVVNFYKKNHKKFDDVSNVRPPTYPDGMDVEILSFAALQKAWQTTQLQSEREHVTLFLSNHPEIFRMDNVKNRQNLSDMRLTLDNQEDLVLIRGIFEALYPRNPHFTLKDILALKEKQPRLFEVNKHIERNEGLKKSLAGEAAQYPEAIIILSGSLRKDGKSGWRTTNFDEGKNHQGLGDRLRIVAGAHLYKEVVLTNLRVVILVSGGKGSLRKILDAPAVSKIMEKELVELHIPQTKIIKEASSRNTFENLLESDKICAKRGWRSVVIISNAYYLPRIKTMIKYYTDKMPHLAAMFFAERLKLMSAEEICLHYDERKYAPIIKKAYRSKAMKERLLLEKQGITDIKKGRYRPC